MQIEPTQPTRRKMLRWLLAAPALAAAVAPARAATNSVVGTWSTRTRNTAGEVTSNIFTTYAADGGFSQRHVIPGITQDYVGQYRLSADGSMMDWVYRDYAPKQSCRYGACYPIRPVVQMNVPGRTVLQWVSPTRFITPDPSGSLVWVRAG